MTPAPMQCAWCRRLYDDSGNLGDPLPSLLPQASGGVCHVCVDRIFRQESERARQGGNLATALHLERERLSLSRDLARERRQTHASRGGRTNSRPHLPSNKVPAYQSNQFTS
jgi:hypothetical protein